MSLRPYGYAVRNTLNSTLSILIRLRARRRDSRTGVFSPAILSAESPRSFDLLVINWLLMYLADDEVTGLLGKLLSTWSRRGGFLFIRESCTEPSDKGSQNRSWAVNGNPTLYRRPEQYTTWINEIARECGKEDALVPGHGTQLRSRRSGPVLRGHSFLVAYRMPTAVWPAGSRGLPG